MPLGQILFANSSKISSFYFLLKACLILAGLRIEIIPVSLANEGIVLGL